MESRPKKLLDQVRDAILTHLALNERVAVSQQKQNLAKS